MPRIIIMTDFSEEFSKDLLKGIVRYAKGKNDWVLCRMPPSYYDLYGLEGVLRWALKWEANGIIAKFNSNDDVSIFKKNGIIALAQDNEDLFSEIPNITGAHRLAGKIGANYYIKKGFKNFAFYGFKNLVWSKDRCEGFKEELVNHKLDHNFYEYQNDESQDIWYYESTSLIKWLKSLPKPIALMACDDNQASHITEVSRLCGIKIPEELTVLGVDDDKAICMLSDPPISSIYQAVEKGGYEAAQLLEKMIDDPYTDYEDIVVYPTHIITRQSTDIYATEDKYIAIVLKYIHQNIDKKLNVGDIANLVPLSRRLLENRFKLVTGFPVYSYIFHLRIEKFAERLLETSDPIADIAVEMGFSDYKNISRQFRTIKGCTPSEYRTIHLVK